MPGVYIFLLRYRTAKAQGVFDVLFQLSLIALNGNNVISAPASLICLVIAVWQPIASIVTIHPFNSNTISSLGMAVISLHFSAVLTCPNTMLFVSAQALTMCMADFALFPRESRIVLPSMLLISPSVSSATLFTHAKNRFQTPTNLRLKTPG